jgi:hypothetical protein
MRNDMVGHGENPKTSGQRGACWTPSNGAHHTDTLRRFLGERHTLRAALSRAWPINSTHSQALRKAFFGSSKRRHTLRVNTATIICALRTRYESRSNRVPKSRMAG